MELHKHGATITDIITAALKEVGIEKVCVDLPSLNGRVYEIICALGDLSAAQEKSIKHRMTECHCQSIPGF